MKNPFSLDNFPPTYRFHKLVNISPHFLHEMGIKGVLIDKDETLIETGSNQLSASIREWLNSMRRSSIHLLISSNSARVRAVRKFASEVDLPFTLCGPAFIYGKPWPRALRPGIQMLGFEKDETLMIDDQILTGVYGGNLVGMRTILVDPLGGHDRLITKLTGRFLERKIIKRLEKRGLMPPYSD